MKKISICIMTVILSLTFVPNHLRAEAAITTTSAAAIKAAESAKANSLLSRLNEINEMDKSKLSSLEKKQLRKEVRSTKMQLKELGGGVYLSVGAIIIILLLLILFL